MAISAAQVKQLRDRTGIGIMDCKAALEATSGDLEKAVEHLRKKGLAAAEKKAGRETHEGYVASYVHSNGKIGVLVEVRCETDFVARNEEFRAFCRDLCMQVAAARPRWVRREDVPDEVLDKEREIYRELFKDKPPQAVEKIVEGKLRSFYEDQCLLDQPFVKEPKTTVGDLVKGMVAKLGENVTVGRFALLEVGANRP